MSFPRATEEGRELVGTVGRMKEPGIVLFPKICRMRTMADWREKLTVYFYFISQSLSTRTS